MVVVVYESTIFYDMLVKRLHTETEGNYEFSSVLKVRDGTYTLCAFRI